MSWIGLIWLDLCWTRSNFPVRNVVMESTDQVRSMSFKPISYYKRLSNSYWSSVGTFLMWEMFWIGLIWLDLCWRRSNYPAKHVVTGSHYQVRSRKFNPFSYYKRLSKSYCSSIRTFLMCEMSWIGLIWLDLCWRRSNFPVRHVVMGITNPLRSRSFKSIKET